MAYKLRTKKIKMKVDKKKTYRVIKVHNIGTYGTSWDDYKIEVTDPKTNKREYLELKDEKNFPSKFSPEHYMKFTVQFENKKDADKWLNHYIKTGGALF